VEACTYACACGVCVCVEQALQRTGQRVVLTGGTHMHKYDTHMHKYEAHTCTNTTERNKEKYQYQLGKIKMEHHVGSENHFPQ
jgi:hypothetical protein